MIYYGITSGMTYPEYIAYLFELNSQLKRKHSDEALRLKLLKEFPSKPAISEAKFKSYRSAYNSGYLSKRIAAPKEKSFRYIKGVIVSRYDQPLTTVEIKRQLRVQLNRWKKNNARRIKEAIKKKAWEPKAKNKVLPKNVVKARRRKGLLKAHKAYKIRYRLQKQVEAFSST